MASYQTHLSLLRETASLDPSAPAFRVPQLDHVSNEIRTWEVITYSQFEAQVNYSARYWARILAIDGILPQSVVGVWLGGMTYFDVLHIYGLSRAGYIPQLFSLCLSNPDVIYELLQKSKGKAIIYDSSFHSLLCHSPVPTHAAVDVDCLDVEDTPLPSHTAKHRGDDTVMIFHTSGSTSGCPKLVSCSYAWWDTIISKAGQVMKPVSHEKHRQDVAVWMGSMCHIGQNFMLLGALQHASCMIQSTQQAFSSEELVDMIDRCNLTRINQFPTYLGIHLRNSRRDPKLLSHLQALDVIFVSGLKLSPEDEEWVQRSGLKLMDCYGSTECGAMMISTPGASGAARQVLRPIAGMAYSFAPVISSVQVETGYWNPNSPLLEMIILGESPDCPDRSLRSADGNYHTGDLFSEVSPGCYVFRGRDDDWIKTENSLRCDTKAIEDNVRTSCAHLVADCVVVGNGRPSPTLLVEPAAGVDHEVMKKEIIRKTRHFHSRRYIHERITSSHYILVVPPGSLPRTATKGNIRRRAVEQAFKADLDRIYRVAY
ncbi:hypothetical protein SCP_0107290 [Sparassis crispa]|uniref:AMP-dependent synthetase/ligase domain-containing protein n=1 Tax=Sparassis crispa TaxID=139825 RepID=A0A401G6S0_9APHY|nr:hypothetical protein SCP_0107290 [Sparassis crispa]GBE77847.1 hypothetical protein SCP_0107290 [Sparassis crispa]